MKSHVHRGAVVVLVLFFSLTPLFAVPRDERAPDVPKIIKILKKLQNLLGISTLDDQPYPPRP